jgi:hypothetical protein
MSGDEAVSPYARRKRNCLILLLVWAVVSGFVFGAVPVDWESPVILLDAIVFMIIVIQWTFLDAAEHGFKLWRYFVPLLVICPGPLVMMPVYFIRSRGWISGLLACALAVAFCLLKLGVDFASCYLAIELFWGNNI